VIATRVQAPVVERNQSTTRGAIKRGRRPMRAAQLGVTTAVMTVMRAVRSSTILAPISLIWPS
jgi:hypothetical protein